jgi:hypothetical protein
VSLYAGAKLSKGHANERSAGRPFRPKTPRTVYRASPRSSSSSSSAAFLIRIIVTALLARRIFQWYRVVDPPRASARSRTYHHKNSSHHSPVVDQRGQGILLTRRRPRALFLVSSIRATSSRTTHHPSPFNIHPDPRNLSAAESSRRRTAPELSVMPITPGSCVP